MNKNIIVYKLGGTSQCVEGYKNLKSIIAEKENINIIVLSAISGVTNLLIKFTETKNIEYINSVIEKSNNLFEQIMCEIKGLKDDLNEYSYIYEKCSKQIKKIYSEIEEYSNDYIKLSNITDIYCKSRIIGYGEIISTNLFNIYLSSLTINNTLLNSYDYIKSKKEIYQISTQSEFYSLPIPIENYPDSNIFVLQGYIGSTPSNKQVLLGRGGSDTTGSLIAKSMRALKYEVWTDVNGIYTSDPRIFERAKIVPLIDYLLCQELSAMGAKVMHPLSIKPCVDLRIPIYIRNTFTLEIGTCIKSNEEQKEIFYAIQQNQTLFKIKSIDMWNSYGFVSNIFRKFSEKNINIDIVSTSQFSITTTTTETNEYLLMEIHDELKEKYEVDIIFNCVILSVVKKNIKSIINKLNLLNIEIEMIHLSDNNLTINLVLKQFNPKIIDQLGLENI